MAGRRTASEAGMTLVELLVAVAILGIAVVSVVAGMGTAVTSSDYNRKQAEAGDQIRAFAARITAAAYAECAGATSYTGSLTPLPGYTVTTAVAYWSWTSNVFSATAPASCPTSDTGLQRVTITVASTDGRDTETLRLVKRRHATGESP